MIFATGAFKTQRFQRTLKNLGQQIRILYTMNRKMFWVISLILMFFQNICIVENVSQSLPQSYWWGVRGFPPQKGTYVLIQKPHWSGKLLKQVTGVAGDHIRRQGSTLWINDKPVCLLHKEEPLMEDLGKQTIPEGYVFVSTPHKFGIDSRYKRPGLIAVEHCKASLWPLHFLNGWR